ncbi:unnamed protein product [Rhizophagus irregularis]|nr:unnamed protein product [Rhizophagus irregularis]
MDNNYNFNFIDDGDIRPQTTDSQTENPNVSMMNTNTPDSVANMSSQSYPITSSDLSFPLPQYTQQIQQAQQPIYQQNNTENNIQQQLFDTTQPISLNVPHFVQNSSSPFDASQINHSEIFT